MKNLITTISLLGIFFLSLNAMAESTLVKLAKADSKDIVQIFLSFDALPKYTHKLAKKRLDIIFEETIIPNDIKLFDSDGRIIKVLPTTRAGRSVLSLFFRYPPQKVNVETSSDNKIVAEILLGNQYSRSYQELSERLKGLTVVESEPVDSTNPLITSPYAQDWDRFFRKYEADITISVPIEFTVPPFPIIALIPPGLEKNMELLPMEFYELAEQNLWDDMQPLILDLLRSTPDIKNQKLLALTYGEALLRHNDYEGAYKQLYLLNREYSDEHVGIVSQYLINVLDTKFHDPYTSDYEYRKLEKLITPTNPIAPYFLISRIETALATKQYNRMKRLLDTDTIPFPGKSQKIRELRLGDFYNVTDQPVKSFVAYKLLKDTPLLKSHPFSLNGFCSTLYNHHKYALASECYRDLSPQINDNESLGLITFRKSMAELKYKSENEMIDSFARIEDAFPGTEAGFRASLKRTDLKYLNDKGWANEAVKYYHALAQRSVIRSTVAESALKEALIHSILGNKEKSVSLLMTFLRDFKLSELRDTALALLVDILPGEIQRNINEGDYMAALVLAKQNRELFQNNWLDIGLLADIANAYQKIGIFSEAQRVYLYLIEVVDVEKREKFFRPLIQSVFDQGEYGLVEDFASQYAYNYPGGNDTEPILSIRIRALIASEQFTIAIELLPSPLSPNREIRLLAAELHFKNDDFEKVIDALTILNDSETGLPTNEHFLLAESNFQTQKYDKAEELFLQLENDNRFGEQSLYRLAQIEREKGNFENSLKLFQKIVEKGNDTLWRKYAERELEYSQLTKTIESLIEN